MRVIMTGGGTGGHIYPAIAIADKIKEKEPNSEILFVGTEKGLERKIVPEAGYPIKYITVSGFNRKQIWKNIKVVGQAIKASSEAKKIIKEFKPDLVVGTGGYVCGPVVRAAHKLGIKTFIHEQNAFPGVTNKLLEKYVEKVFISFPEAEAYFKNRKKLLLTGNPVRKNFLKVDVRQCREKLNVPQGAFVVLCFGGSRGAGRINEVITELADKIKDDSSILVHFITGSVHYKGISKKLTEKGIGKNSNVKVVEYTNEMDVYMGAADLVISRAGAIAVTEIAAMGKPCILIPSPNVTGNHQFFNALSLSSKGGAILIEEKDLNLKGLMRIISEFHNDYDKLSKMSRVTKGCFEGDASETIVEYIRG